MEIKKTYESIENHIHLVEEKFGKGSKLAEMFKNCISNTLQTTIKILDDGSVLSLQAIFLPCGSEIPPASSVRLFYLQKKTRPLRN